MYSMKQNIPTIFMRDLMEREDGWGNVEGRAVYQKLLEVIEANPGTNVFGVSFKEVVRTDVSFARESIIEMAVRFRGKKGFFLIDMPNPDLLENWVAAAIRRNQSITVKDSGGKLSIYGPEPSRGNKALLELLLKSHETSATEVAKRLKISITNASTKLKQLLEAGFILRRDEPAASGGVEYKYFVIGKG